MDAPVKAWRSVAAALLVLLGAGSGVQAGWEVSNRVIIQHGNLVIDHGKGLAEITQAQKSGGFRADIGLGLFQNRIRTELEIGPPRPGRGGGRLALTTRIITEPVIYVARELPRDSCAYRAVLGHELLHQQFDLRVLRALPDEVRRFSQDLFSDHDLGRPSGLDPGRFKSRFNRQFNYVYDALSLPLHGAIDNPESYAQLARACNGEIATRLAGGQPGP